MRETGGRLSQENHQLKSQIHVLQEGKAEALSWVAQLEDQVHALGKEKAALLEQASQPRRGHRDRLDEIAVEVENLQQLQAQERELLSDGLRNAYQEVQQGPHYRSQPVGQPWLANQVPVPGGRVGEFNVAQSSGVDQAIPVQPAVAVNIQRGLPAAIGMNPGVHVPLPRQLEYDGSSISFNAFLESFSAGAEMAGWQEAHRLYRL